MSIYPEYALRLILAVICGGFIGYERKASNHPAGLRTHIIVCVAATLVLITSESIFERYVGATNMDPMRLGAQIISGIGFLGAGAIVKEGVTVKGLTTAACLWAVGCIGIALGVGFYFGAIIATAIAFAVLTWFRHLERFLTRGRNFYVLVIEVQSEGRDAIMEKIESIFAVFHAKVHRINSIEVCCTTYLTYDFLLYTSIPRNALVKSLSQVEGVVHVLTDTGTAVMVE